MLDKREQKACCKRMDTHQVLLRYRLLTKPCHINWYQNPLAVYPGGQALTFWRLTAFTWSLFTVMQKSGFGQSHFLPQGEHITFGVGGMAEGRKKNM